VAKPVRSVLIIAVLVLVLVAGAIVAVLALSPGASHFPPDSPEAAFQNYLNAYNARDFGTAFASFSAQARGQLSADDYARRARTFGDVPPDENQRILIGQVEKQGAAVVLHVTIEHVSGSGLELNRWSYEQTVPLVREDGAWKIDNLLLGTTPFPPEFTH
jgi:hypothetical protein